MSPDPGAPRPLDIYRRLLGYARPHWPMFLLGVVGMALSAAVEVGWLKLIRDFLDGTFVNHAGLAQKIKRCVKPPGECRSEGQVFFDLLGKRGLIQADAIRKEMATEVPFFAPLGNGIGELGMKLV